MGLRVRYARRWYQRLGGLLIQAPLGPDEALCLYPCNSVHTAAMPYAIDVLFVAADGRVLRRVHNLTPWRLACCWNAVAAFELPAGAAQRHEAALLLWWRSRP